MLCDVKGCTELAKYLVKIKNSRDVWISFNLCEKHNKLKWVLEKSKEKKP
jgi:hypothetical protein